MLEIDLQDRILRCMNYMDIYMHNDHQRHIAGGKFDQVNIAQSKAPKVKKMFALQQIAKIIKFKDKPSQLRCALLLGHITNSPGSPLCDSVARLFFYIFCVVFSQDCVCSQY